jgi:DNA repair ATPase RecN
MSGISDMSEVNERLARVEQDQKHQGKQLDRLVDVTEKLVDVHVRMSSLEKRHDTTDERITKIENQVLQNAKQIAKWTLICTIALGLIVKYVPELSVLIGLR